MAEIHIVREHALGLEQARRLALRWAEVAQKKLDMACTYAEGGTSDVVGFRRHGAHGELRVTEDRFELRARLGLLFAMFRHRIETEIVKNLDALLAHGDPLHAFEQGLARHEERHVGRHRTGHPKPPGEAHKPVAKAGPAGGRPGRPAKSPGSGRPT